jgi:hypothetical protein
MEDGMANQIPKLFFQMGESLRLTLRNGHIMASLILMYSYIDAMASLIMPEGQKDVRGRDYIKWVDTYMKSGSPQYEYRGIDLWGARCGLVHRYSPNSTQSDNGRCKTFVYSTKADHIFDPKIDKNVVVVSANRIVNDFFGAMSKFIQDLLNNVEMLERANRRFEEFFQEVSREDARHR